MASCSIAKLALVFGAGVSVGYLLSKLSKKKDEQLVPVLKADSEDLLSEQLVRNYQFFGEEAMKRIRSAFVVVVGVGGVGSHCVNMLARAGVKKI